MKKSRKQNNPLLVKARALIPAMTVSGILIVLALFAFTIFNGAEIRKNNHAYLKNDTMQAAESLERAVEDGLNNIQTMSTLIGQSLTSPEVDISRYQELIQNTTFDFVEFADRDGVDHNVTGGVSDASDRPYYLEAMQGRSGVLVVFNSRATHENLLDFYAPVYYQGQIIGSLVGVYQASNRMTELLRLDYFGESGTAYLCNEEGRVFASSLTLDASRELYLDEILDTDEENRALVKNAIQSGQAASFMADGYRASGYIMQLPETEWFLAQIYPSSINMRMIHRANAMVMVLVLVLMAVFITLQMYVYDDHRQQQARLEAAVRESRSAREDEEKQLRILRSMAEIYYSMHLVDLPNNTTVVYIAKNQVKDLVNNASKADEAMRKTMEATMTEGFLDIGLAFSDISTLAERMENKKIIFMDLLGKNVGWIRMSFITIEADERGRPRKVICATQIIDEEKKREERLLRESNTDEQTGCLNRRAYEEFLMHEQAVPETFTYVTMDLNGLKTVNDSLGHAVGDELIFGAVQCIRRCLGNYGKIYRTGGDEFVALIYADAQTLERIMQDFEDVQTQWTGKRVSSLSISTGYVAKREFPDLTITELARIADQRMYAAKGRYYKTKGVDRRGQSAAHAALCALYTKILRVNLTMDTYDVISMDMTEQTNEKGFAKTISGWLYGFGTSGQVHPEDRDEFLRQTDRAFLRDYFRRGKTTIVISYRRKIGNVYKHVVMEMIPAKEYADDNEALFLFVKPVDR